MSSNHQSSENKNLLISVVLSIIIMGAWQFFVEPQAPIQPPAPTENATIPLSKLESVKPILPPVSLAKKITISNSEINGELSTQGLTFTNIILKNYHESIDPLSANVQILTNGKDSYTASFGWTSNSTDIDLPNKDTVWTSSEDKITDTTPSVLTWRNKQNILFKVIVSLDKNYMLKLTQSIENSSLLSAKIGTYGTLQRVLPNAHREFFILHEGLIGTSGNLLKEITYEDISEKKSLKLPFVSGDWVGMTDKYWLTALIPQQGAEYSEMLFLEDNKFQVDFLGKLEILQPNSKVSSTTLLFVGAKKVDLLGQYESQYKISLFNRAVDFGWFYFLTQPIDLILQKLFAISGNFGLAIIMMTFLLKILMFPLANKSYRSMNRMKELAPKIAEIRELCGGDKLRANQEMMALYQKEKLSPLSGCLPMLIQIPVFFSLYKVIFISIEMRQAQFYGWIHDLSVPDPTSLFNLFGMINWTPPEFLQIGVLPILMGVTMWAQQKLNPEPADPVQAQVMKLLPWIFIVIFRSFPAGLMLYWSVSNTLSILQQLYLKRTHK